MPRRRGSLPRRDTTQRLLVRLVLAQGAVVPDAQLLMACYGRTMPRRAQATLAVLVHRVRLTLAHPAALTRVRHVGYRLAPAEHPHLPPLDLGCLVPG